MMTVRRARLVAERGGLLVADPLPELDRAGQFGVGQQAGLVELFGVEARDRPCTGRRPADSGDFTLAMAQAVDPARAAPDLEACLLRLADRSLISANLAAGQPARYRLLGTIRAHASGQEPEVAAQVRHAHARYCCELAAAEVRARRQPSPATPAAVR
jgi:hypothetical protein